MQLPTAWTRGDGSLCPSPVHQAIFDLAPDPIVPLTILNSLRSQVNHGWVFLPRCLFLCCSLCLEHFSHNFSPADSFSYRHGSSITSSRKPSLTSPALCCRNHSPVPTLGPSLLLMGGREPGRLVHCCTPGTETQWGQ